MTLKTAEPGKEYFIEDIRTDDEEMDAFLFSLGCYAGEPITVISRRRGTCVVSIKDGRYTIGDELAECIYLYFLACQLEEANEVRRKSIP